MSESTLKQSGENKGSLHSPVGDHQIHPNVLNEMVARHAIETIGMGLYQWQLLVSCAFGFVVDQMLLISISIVMPQASKEFLVEHPTLLSATQYASLLIGAVVYGFLSDTVGRRLAWQVSLFGVSVFTIVSASAPTWAALNVFVAFCGFFGGGNLAIDLTILAESLPHSHDWLLTGVTCVWGLGNSITTLIGWPLVVNLCCPDDATVDSCKKQDNMGWRYLYIILGALCLVFALLRAFAMTMCESPTWLLSKGKLDKALAALNEISRINRSSHVTEIDQFVPPVADAIPKWRANLFCVRKLFENSRRARMMICLMLMWTTIGIAYPLYTMFLPYYLHAHNVSLGDGGSNQTYRDLAISSIVGIFGPIVTTYLTFIPHLGYKPAFCLTAAAAAAFSGAFTSITNETQNLAFSCMLGFWNNALYAAFYAYTPQVMPTETRATGSGLNLASGRLGSLAAPLIATYTDVGTSVPIWICLGLYIFIGILALLLPFKPSNIDIMT